MIGPAAIILASRSWLAPCLLALAALTAATVFVLASIMAFFGREHRGQQLT